MPSDPTARDDLDEFLAEELRDPAFASTWKRAWRHARRRFAVERGRHLSSMRSSYRRRKR